MTKHEVNAFDGEFSLNAYFADASNRHESGTGFRRVRCWDGLTFSAQVGEGRFCLPTNDCGPWTAVEIGFPSREVEEFKGFEDSCDPDDPTGVYSRVPVEVVESVVKKHGGWIWQEPIATPWESLRID